MMDATVLFQPGAGIDGTAQVSLPATTATLGKRLDLALGSVGLRWEVHDEMLWIVRAPDLHLSHPK